MTSMQFFGLGKRMNWRGLQIPGRRSRGKSRVSRPRTIHLAFVRRKPGWCLPLSEGPASTDRGILDQVKGVSFGDADLFLTELMRNDPQDITDAQLVAGRTCWTQDTIALLLPLQA